MSYPAEYDPEKLVVLGPEMAYWRAWARSAEPAVTPLTALLGHSNALVRGLAAQTLGELDAVAKPAATKLKEALKDRFGFVAVEAACALCRIGEGKEEAVELVKRGSMRQITWPRRPSTRLLAWGTWASHSSVMQSKKLGDKENPYARFAAIGLVGTLPPAEATKVAADVGKLATDSERDIRSRAAIVLEQLGPDRCARRPALGQALATEMDEAIRDQFVDALIAMGPARNPPCPHYCPWRPIQRCRWSAGEDHCGHRCSRPVIEGSGRCAGRSGG